MARFTFIMSTPREGELQNVGHRDWLRELTTEFTWMEKGLGKVERESESWVYARLSHYLRPEMTSWGQSSDKGGGNAARNGPQPLRITIPLSQMTFPHNLLVTL